MTSLTSMCEMAYQIVQNKLEEKRIEEEQAAKAQNSKIPACCDDDDDYNSAVTPNEPVDSLSMGDEHLNTIPATKSDEFIKSCVENLVPNPKSMLNRDSSIISSSSKIDSLLDEFVSELTLLKSIPLGIDETDRDPEKDIRLTERLLYDNSSPRPPKEFVSDNSDADIESFSLSPIPVEDSDSRMEEIDLPFTPDDPMPSGIEKDDYDSERLTIIPFHFLSQPMLKSSYKAEDGVIISIPPLVGGVADVVVEIKGTVSKLGCVLCHDAVAFCLRRLPAFCLKVTAFCFKTKLRFASRPCAFYSRTHCDLSQEGCALSPRQLCFDLTVF
nr:hypothetical protein [Tanacetum cinerariifolium]